MITQWGGRELEERVTAQRRRLMRGSRMREHKPLFFVHLLALSPMVTDMNKANRADNPILTASICPN
ncbi:hypothetical protein AB990_05000 [Alkalihalobacillus pseudalcaliphilus]|nr:hypothetical protein AB990_05000 [Alkalihalobacillus pseudalcaliphilus]